MATKLSNERYVHYHGNISEQVTKVTQTKTNYDQFQTQYAVATHMPVMLTRVTSHNITYFVLYFMEIFLNICMHLSLGSLLKQGQPWTKHG